MRITNAGLLPISDCSLRIKTQSETRDPSTQSETRDLLSSLCLYSCLVRSTQKRSRIQGLVNPLFYLEKGVQPQINIMILIYSIYLMDSLFQEDFRRRSPLAADFYTWWTKSIYFSRLYYSIFAISQSYLLSYTISRKIAHFSLYFNTHFQNLIKFCDIEKKKQHEKHLKKYITLVTMYGNQRQRDTVHDNKNLCFK